MYKRLYFFGIGAYIIMLILSILFYKERIIILDTAFALFHIVRKASFSLYASRCGALLTQILPVLVVKTGASLNIATLSYSVGFTFFYFVCYLLCGFGFKRYDLGLVLLLFHILFVTDTFYYIPSELPQGVNFFVVGLAMIPVTRKKNALLYRAVFFLFFFFSAFFHPLISFVILYTTLFFYFHKDALFDKKALISIAVIYLLGLLVNNLFFRIDYDRHAMSGVKNFVALFPNYINLYSNKVFLHDCLTKYYWLPICPILITNYYFYRKEWQKLLLFLCSFLGYLLLVNVSYYSIATPPFVYGESILTIGCSIGLSISI